jgi:hypothetical protein
MAPSALQRLQHFHRFGDDLGADAVTGENQNLLTQWSLQTEFR